MLVRGLGRAFGFEGLAGAWSKESVRSMIDGRDALLGIGFRMAPLGITLLCVRNEQPGRMVGDFHTGRKDYMFSGVRSTWMFGIWPMRAGLMLEMELFKI
jgi:hypothetical protein